MQKVILGERTTKELTLPECKAVLVVYSSLTVGDLNGIEFDESVTSGVKVLVRIIKSWNIFAGESEKEPLPITEENISKLPVSDLTFLMGEVETFATAQKKS